MLQSCCTWIVKVITCKCQHGTVAEVVLDFFVLFSSNCLDQIVMEDESTLRFRSSQRWTNAIRQVCRELNNMEAPRFSVDKLSEFEQLFIDESGEETDLSPEQFIEGFERIVGGHYIRSQWMKLFVDIDADRGGTVSWDEFTTFMVHQSVGLVAEYGRAKELVALPPPSKVHNAHKEPAKILLSLDKTDQYASTGSDGTVRIWGPDLSHQRTIFNSKLAASSVLSSYVSTVPICDMTIAGNICSVASVDKCINLFQSDGMQLCRRYIGRNLFNDISIPPLFLDGNSKPVDTCILMGMSDALASAELCQLPSGRELFFAGLMDGSVLVYPSNRHSKASEIRPLFSVQGAHKGSVTKVRYEGSFNHIISTGWDAAICVTDAETGIVTTRFEASPQGEHSSTVGHSKAIIDFSYQETSKMLATVSSERDICLWNPSMATPIQKLSGHTGVLVTAKFNDQENQMISLSQDNMIKIWDMRTFRTFQTIVFNNPHRMSALCYDHRKNRLIGMAGVPYSWCVRRTYCGFPASYRGHIEPIVGMCYHKELDVLVTSDVSTHMTWEAKDGGRLLVWEGVSEPQKFAATCLDFSGRRLCAVTKEGGVFIYNHRSGQLLREDQAPGVDDVVACIYLARLPNHIYLAVIAAQRVVFMKEVEDNDFNTFDVALPEDFVVVAQRGPSDSYGVPTVVLGTAAGGLVIVSATSRGVVNRLAPPCPALGDPLQEFAGEAPISKQVESIVVCMIKGLIITVCSDRCVYLWGTGKKGALLFTCELAECPAMLVALANDLSERHLFCGDETGAVHTFNIEKVPVDRKHAVYRRDQFQHVVSFTSHRCSVTSIVCLSHRALLIVCGSDLKFKLLDYYGRLIGTFGEDQWCAPKPSRVDAVKDRLRRPTCFTAASKKTFLTAVLVETPHDHKIDPVVTHSCAPTLTHDFLQTLPSVAQSRSSLLDEINKMHRRSMTPALGTKRRSGILKRSFTPSPMAAAAHVSSDPDPLSVSDLRDAAAHSMRSRSPTKYRGSLDDLQVRDCEPHLPPIVSLRHSYDSSRSASREWARAKPDYDTCRGEQRSETSRKIFDARRSNPTGWSNFTIASFLPVQEIPTSLLQPSVLAKKLPALSKKTM